MPALWLFAAMGAGAVEPPDPVESLPVPKKKEYPSYPWDAGTAATGQQCLVDAAVDAEGVTTSVEAFRCDPLLIDATQAALSQWRWKPAMLAGIPVALTARVGVGFLASGRDHLVAGRGVVAPEWTVEPSDQPGCVIRLAVGPDYRVAARSTSDGDRCAPQLPTRLWDPGLGFPDSTECERDFSVSRSGRATAPFRFDACTPAGDVFLHEVMTSMDWDDPPVGPVHLIAAFDSKLPRGGVPELYPLIGVWFDGDSIETWTAVDDVLYGVAFDAKRDGSLVFRVDVVQRVDGVVELLRATGASHPDRYLLTESDARTFVFRTPPEQLPTRAIRFAREPAGAAAHALVEASGSVDSWDPAVTWTNGGRDRSGSLDRATAVLAADVHARGAAAWMDAFEAKGRVWTGPRWNVAPSEAATGVFAKLSTGALSLEAAGSGVATGSTVGYTTGSWQWHDATTHDGGTWLAIWRHQHDGGWKIARMVWGAVEGD
jgi:hypothetical protein